MLCCQLTTLEITLNKNQVKVNANKNIYLQNIKTDNIVTSIYKDTHDKKERNLCLIYLLQCQRLWPLLHYQYTNHQCLANPICQRHKSSVIGNLDADIYRARLNYEHIINHLKDKKKKNLTTW